MNTANKLTMLRVVMIPLFLLVQYIQVPHSGVIALLIYILACATDWLDGYVARRYHQTTDFGKFMDPLADKILVMAAMCYFVEIGQMKGWVLAVVLMREFAVSGMRMIAVEQGRVIAAGWSGKVKTASTMLCLCCLLCMDALELGWESQFNVVCQAIILVTTVYSGVEYFWKNRDIFRHVK